MATIISCSDMKSMSQALSISDRACFVALPPGQDLRALARALASSPVWQELAQARLVVKPCPAPHLAIFGAFTPADQPRLANLAHRLTHSLPRLRHVSYAQAQADCLKLAERLLERFGPAAREFHYMAIPRGGHIVLGMLAYALGLRSDRLSPPKDAQTPLVVVDDCALSGVRFRSVLAGLPSDDVIFAPLYAPAELRRRIVRHEPRLRDCLSAHDLQDEAPERLGAGHADWLRAERGRDGGRSYWYGQYPPLSFAWNEPDSTFWNPETGRPERAWNLVPPEHCLKTLIGWDPDAARIQVNEDGLGPLFAAKDVLYADFGDRIVLAEAGTGQTHALDDVAADMWRALMRRGDVKPALSDLCAVYDVEEGVLARDLQDFTEMLFTKGLLERRDDSANRGSG